MAKQCNHLCLDLPITITDAKDKHRHQMNEICLAMIVKFFSIVHSYISVQIQLLSFQVIMLFFAKLWFMNHIFLTFYSCMLVIRKQQLKGMLPDICRNLM
jgi:hypothetical protein